MRPTISAKATGRVAIVTGGSRGIGRAVARKLASQSHAVVVNYAGDQRAGDDAVLEILHASGTALAVRADVADELDVERLFAETIEAFGGADVLVHAAGQTIIDPLADRDLEMFDAVQRTNVRGTFVVNQQAARQLRDGGAIVNLSSSAAGLAHPTCAAHAACKGAVEAITLVLARELLGRDITVNAVAPEPMAADALLGEKDETIRELPTRTSRLGTPTEVANVVAFLVSEDGRWINGQVIRAEGESV